MGKERCIICKRRCKGSVLRVDSDFIHNECFKCIVCKCDLERSGFYRQENKFFCRKDYLHSFGTRCGVCHEIINGEVMNMLGSAFHPACFYCSHCRILFKGGDKATLWNGKYYCSSCRESKRRQISYQPLSTSTPVAVKKTLQQNGNSSSRNGVSRDEDTDHDSGRKSSVCSSKGHVRIQDATSSDEIAGEEVLERNPSALQQTIPPHSCSNGHSTEKPLHNAPDFDSGDARGKASTSSTRRSSSCYPQTTDESVNGSHVNSNGCHQTVVLNKGSAFNPPTFPNNYNNTNGGNCVATGPTPSLSQQSQLHTEPTTQPHQQVHWSPEQGAALVKIRNRSAAVCDEERWRHHTNGTDNLSTTYSTPQTHNFSYLYRQVEMALNPDIPLRDHYHRSASGYSTPISLQPGMEKSSGCRSPPQFHRPQGIRFSYRNIPSYKAEWRRDGAGAQRQYASFSYNHSARQLKKHRKEEGSIISSVRSGNDGDEEVNATRMLATYPHARPPAQNEVPAIERLDWPSPPSLAVLRIEKNHQKCPSLPNAPLQPCFHNGLQAVQEQQTPEHGTNVPDGNPYTAVRYVAVKNGSISGRQSSGGNSRWQTLIQSIAPPTTDVGYVIHQTSQATKFTSPSCPTNLSSYLTPRPNTHGCHQIVNRLPPIYRQQTNYTRGSSILNDQNSVQKQASMTSPNFVPNSHTRASSWTKGIPSGVSMSSRFCEVVGARENDSVRRQVLADESTSPCISPTDAVVGDAVSVTDSTAADTNARAAYAPPNVQDWLRSTEAGFYIHLPNMTFKAPPSVSQTYPYGVLKEPTRRPRGLDVTKLETYLCDEEFRALFQVSREDFALLPLWKQNDLKRRVGLF